MTPAETAREIIALVRCESDDPFCGAGMTDESIADVRKAIRQALTKARAEAFEEAAKIAETWAQDNETVQPSFTRMASAIRTRAKEGSK